MTEADGTLGKSYREKVLPGCICSCALPVGYHRPQSISQMSDIYNITGSLQPAYLPNYVFRASFST